MHSETSDSVSNGSLADSTISYDEDEDRLEVPLIQTRSHKVSATWTLMNFLRGMIGPGCLALPVAFKQAGLWAGLALIFFLGFLNTHCMMMLVECAQYLCDKSGKLELDYGHLAKKAFDYGPSRLRPYGKHALFVTNIVICALQIGICAVLFVFMSSHVKEVFEHYDTQVSLSPKVYLAILLLPVILVTYIRSLALLAILSTIGNLLMVLDFVIIFQAIVSMPTLIATLPGVKEPFSIVLASGSILYSFEGQAMILPMENKMDEPKAMVGWNGVLSTGMAIVTCIYAATGFFGYSAFGDKVEGSITLNLPQDNVLYDIVKLILVAVVYVGYAIQAYVVVEMLWPAVRRKMLAGREGMHLLLEYVFRTALVLITFVLAIAVPKLELIIPLVGVSAGMLLAFIFPPFIELVTYWDSWHERGMSPGLVRVHMAKNVLLMVIGVFGLIIGTYSNIAQIIKEVSKPQ